MNCALTILLLNISRGHDASYIPILFTFWVVIIVYVFYITLKNPSFVE